MCWRSNRKVEKIGRFRMKKFTKILLEEYRSRLFKAISEVNVVDDHGNVIISKDLKVRHKKSGYEYTVDDVKGSGEDIEIVLRDPEEPRVEPDPEEEIISDSLDLSDLGLTADDINLEDEEDIFIVNKKDFEKEFEVD